MGRIAVTFKALIFTTENTEYTENCGEVSKLESGVLAMLSLPGRTSLALHRFSVNFALRPSALFTSYHHLQSHLILLVSKDV